MNPVEENQIEPNPSNPANEVTESKMQKKKIIIIVLFSALIVPVAMWLLIIQPNKSQTDSSVSSSDGSSSSESSKHGDRIRLIATGDFIAHDAVNKNALKSDGSYDYLQFMQDFVPVFKTADIRFCNDPILNGGKEFGITGYPNFNSPTEFVDDMKGLGCNLVNTASNHSFDKTQAVIDASVAAWEKQSDMLAVAGQNRDAFEHDKVHTFTAKGVKVAFLAYTTYLNKGTATNNYGVNVFSKGFAGKQITEARYAGAKVIIVSMRWGTEYSLAVNASQKSNSQWLADQGVNLVLGHGPHVLQPVNKLKGSGGNETVIWYSLGNFLNTQEPVESLFGSLGVVDFNVSDGTISGLGYLPIYMHYEWTAAEKAAGDLLARNNLKLYLLDDVNQSFIDKNQLKTSVSAQEDRIKQTLNSLTTVKRLSVDEYYQ